jgi:hypothetical protein
MGTIVLAYNRCIMAYDSVDITIMSNRVDQQISLYTYKYGPLSMHTTYVCM